MPSRSAAHRAILDGRVTVVGIAEPRPSTRVAELAEVFVEEAATRFVGRGGHKLEAALQTFGVPVAGRTALDIGSSTGGFTDCLLQHGATAVVSVDVGTGQLHHDLRRDGRVTSHEQTDIRDVAPADIGAPFEVIVADVSFLALSRLAPTVAAFGDATTDYIMLVKPQFEAGPGATTKRGVVVDPELREQSVRSVQAAFAAMQIEVAGTMVSPVSGAAGNTEFLLWLRSGDAPRAVPAGKGADLG